MLRILVASRAWPHKDPSKMALGFAHIRCVPVA
jgi:hypothetical protein